MQISIFKRKVFAVLFFAALIAGGFYFWRQHFAPSVVYKTAAEKNVYVRFDMEAYDDILQNYWKSATGSDMAQLFQLSLQKAGNFSAPPIIASPDRAGVANMLLSVFKTATSSEAEKNLALNTLNVALYNLIPQGRDELLSSAQETTLRQTVANVNPSNDLYQNLGLQKGAGASEIDAAYKEKSAQLAGATTTQAKAELAQISYAHEVLSNAADKQVYDQTQIEPTVWSRVIGDTLYLDMDKISPTTLAEFARAVDAASTTPQLSDMILDLRGNIGGDLSFPQYFLGLFLGPNQYAFDLYHQGNYEAERTLEPKWPELDRYKEMAVLTDGMTQSTAELLTATLKRFRIAVVVGGKTRGWGSVENTYPLQTVIDPNEKYSLLLVNGLTLGEDNQPIEQNGVSPDIDTSDANWKEKLPDYFRSQSIIKAVEQIATEKPLE
jgi:hypothetical protein